MIIVVMHRHKTNIYKYIYNIRIYQSERGRNRVNNFNLKRGYYSSNYERKIIQIIKPENNINILY